MNTTGGMATIPGRVIASGRAKASIAPVLDTFLFRDEPIGWRMDDARKFFDLEKYDGYIFTLDDDLIYSSMYVDTMIASIEQYNRKAVITLHGGVVDPPIESYYNGGRDPKYSCLLDQAEDHRVHIPGTGVMAYHTDTIRFSMHDFPEQNMADIQAGIKCNELGVPVVCIAHRHGIVRHIETPSTIYNDYKDRDEVQTRLVNDTVWRKI